MSLILPVATRNSRLQLLVTAAGANAQIKLINGTRPLNGGALIGGNTTLADLVADTVLGTVTNSVLTFNAITRDELGNANGTPTFARVFASNGTTWICDFDVVGFPAIVSGQPVEISSLSITDVNYDV